MAALFGCALLTGVGGVESTVTVRPGDSVVVLGLGGVGLAAVMGAAQSGATTLIAVDPVPAKRELARQLGASHAVGPGRAGPRPHRWRRPLRHRVRGTRGRHGRRLCHDGPRRHDRLRRPASPVEAARAAGPAGDRRGPHADRLLHGLGLLHYDIVNPYLLDLTSDEQKRISQAWVDVRVGTIWAGSNEIMKEIIGRDLGL